MPEPEVPGKQELPDGKLIQLPPAKDTHNTLVDSVLRLLQGVVGRRARIGRGFQMSPDAWLQPDVSVAWPDERYVKVRNERVYLSRLVDRAGKTVDFYLSPKRDAPFPSAAESIGAAAITAR
jgi:hypothetical protein